MPTETLTLQLNFKDSTNKQRSLNLDNIKEDLTKETIQQAMTKIASSHLINKKGVVAYQSPQAARYIRRTVSDVFSTAKD